MHQTLNVGSTLTDFEKFHPPQNKKPPSTFIDFLDFPPSTPCLLELCAIFFQKIPPSTFIPTSTFSDLATFAPSPRLFQPPRLLERWEYAVYSTCFICLWFMILKKQKKISWNWVWPHRAVGQATSVNELDFVKHANNYLVLLEGCRTKGGGRGTMPSPRFREIG